MEHTKLPSFITHSGRSCDRNQARRIINNHVSRWWKENRSQKLRSKHSRFTASQTIQIYLRAEREGQILSRHDSTVPKSLGVSPFYPSTPKAGMLAQDWETCHYYFSKLIHEDNVALELSPVQGQERITALLRWACTFDLIFHALITWTLCSLPESQQCTSQVGKKLLFHRKHLLRRIHDQLSEQKVDDVLIQGVTLLIPIDDHLGYTDFSQAHLVGIERMVESRGGIAQVGSSEPAIKIHLATLVSISTTKLSVNTLPQTPCTGSVLLHPSLPVLSSACDELSRLPTGFRELALIGQISFEMIQIMLDFDLWIKHLTKRPSRISRGAWRFTVPSGLNNIERHICTALLCLADDLSSMGLYYGSLIFRKPQKRAELLLMDDQLWGSEEYTDIVVWLAIVISTPLRPEHTPFTARLMLYKRITRENGSLQQWKHVEVILQKFFYCEERVQAWKYGWESTNSILRPPSTI